MQQTTLRRVYLIRLDDLHKIGHSADPAVRLGQVTSGGDGVLIHAFESENAQQIEHALHRRFSSCHVRGEWFRLDEADVDAICRLPRTDAVDDLPPDLQPLTGVKSPCTGRPRKPRPTEAIQIRVDPALARAIEALAERNHHTRTQEIILIIEEKLKEEGLWPPAQEGGK